MISPLGADSAEARSWRETLNVRSSRARDCGDCERPLDWRFVLDLTGQRYADAQRKYRFILTHPQLDSLSLTCSVYPALCIE